LAISRTEVLLGSHLVKGLLSQDDYLGASMVFKSTMFVLKLTDKRKIRIYKKRHGTGKKKKPRQNKTKQNKTEEHNIKMTIPAIHGRFRAGRFDT
jgi:hypothetical protein